MELNNGDHETELQVFDLSIENSLSWKNVHYEIKQGLSKHFFSCFLVLKFIRKTIQREENQKHFTKRNWVCPRRRSSCNYGTQWLR
jgi:hypothetical protein